MTDLEQDLRERWLPSSEQMKLADSVLFCGFHAQRADGERGVYTGHLLLNKEYGFWTADVQLAFLDGVFLTRDAVLLYVHEAARQRYDLLGGDSSGEKLTGGYAWHPRQGEAAVWEDILSRFPQEVSS